MIAALIDLQGLVVARAQQPMDGQMTFAMPAQPQPYLGYDYQRQMGSPQTPGYAPGGALADDEFAGVGLSENGGQIMQAALFQDDQAPAMSDVATGQSSAAGKGTNGGGYIEMGQAKYWSPIDGGANAGNIVINGAGLSCDLFQRRNLRIAPVVEIGGWTVLDGFETLSSPTAAHIVPNTARIPVDPDVTKIDPATGKATIHETQDPPGSGGRPAPKTHGVQIANGDTIVNAKFGFRTYFTPRDDIYIGWGRALTGDRWYQDVVRVEFRRSF